MNLKDEYNEAFVVDLANKIYTKASSFNTTSFTKSILNNSWKNKELKERVRWISENINSHLQLAYQKQIAILLEIAPNYGGLKGFIFPDFVQVFGLNDLKTSFKAMELFTQYSTAEFAIRPFIEMYPNETMKQIMDWSLHENHHLRRLSSEGSRPRLPWAPPLRRFIQNPKPNLPILENLIDDESEYVRKSVANHLNDISKNHPDLVLQLAKNWVGNSKNRNWIVKHGLRTLLKKGNKEALEIFGLDNSKEILIENLLISSNEIKIGDFIYFEFNVINHSEVIRNIRLEYKIDYVKANGSTSKKVFQISEFCLKSKATKSFKRKQGFKELTTRKHYSGQHKITLFINGDEKSNITLSLVN